MSKHEITTRFDVGDICYWARRGGSSDRVVGPVRVTSIRVNLEIESVVTYYKFKSAIPGFEIAWPDADSESDETSFFATEEEARKDLGLP